MPKSDRNWVPEPQSINLWKIHCDSVEDVVQSPIMLELVEEVWASLTDIVRGHVLSDIDFSNIREIYDRVYLQWERLISQEDYDTLYEFVTSDDVKSYFIRLLDMENIEMSWSAKKQATLKDDILQLTASRKTEKFKPVISYLLSILKNKVKFDDNVLIGYRLHWSYVNSDTRTRTTSTQRDNELEIHSFISDKQYGLVWYRGEGIFELAAEYTSIYHSHKCEGTTLIRANKDSGRWCLVVVWDEIKEAWGFDYTKIPTFESWKLQIASKKSWKWLVYFDGKKIVELTDFESSDIEAAGDHQVYVLSKGKSKKTIVHVWSNWETKEYEWEDITSVKAFHNTTELGEGFLIWRVYRSKEWGYLRVWKDGIEEFSDKDFTDLPLFKDGLVQFAKKEAWKGIVRLTEEWVEEQIVCKYNNITEGFSVGERKVYKGAKWNWVYELVYGVGGEWSETNFDIKKTWGIATWNLWIVKTKDGDFIIVRMKEDWLETVLESCSEVVRRTEDNLELVTTNPEWKKTMFIQQKDGSIMNSKTYYIEIEWADSRGFIQAKKDTWYGLLKIIDWEIREVSSFDFESLKSLEDYKKYILEKSTWKGIAEFSKNGLIWLTDFEYDTIGSFDSRGLAQVSKEWKIGLLHRKNWEYKRVLECEYDEIRDFNEKGLAIATRNGEWYWVLHAKSWVVREFSETFDFTEESVSQVIIGEYRVWRMYVTNGEDKREGFAMYNKDGIKDLGSYDYEDIEHWNQEGNIFYWKRVDWNWWVLVQKWNEIINIWEHHDYIDAPSCIWDKKLDAFQKESWYGYVHIAWDTFRELSDFEFDDNLPEIDEEWKYIWEKDWKYGLIEYFDWEIGEGSEFVFDNSWDPNSREVQHNSIAWEAVIFYNTPRWIKIMEQWIEELRPYSIEWYFLMKKNDKYALVQEVEKDGMTDYEYITGFDFLEFWEADKNNIILAKKDSWTGLLLLDNWKIKEINIIAEETWSLWIDINFQCEEIERYYDDYGIILFDVRRVGKERQLYGYSDSSMFPYSSTDYIEFWDFECYGEPEDWYQSGEWSIGLFRAISSKVSGDGVSAASHADRKLQDVIPHEYFDIKLFNEFAIVSKDLKDFIIFLWGDTKPWSKLEWGFRNITCLDQEKLLFVMTHWNNDKSLFEIREWQLVEISPHVESVDTDMYDDWNEVLIKIYEKWQAGILRRQESGTFYIAVPCVHNALIIDDGRVKNPTKMWWFQWVSLNDPQ